MLQAERADNVFYHCDSFSIRSRHIVLDTAIKENRQRISELLQRRQVVPQLEDAGKKDAPENVKVEALCAKYGFRHFKDARSL